MTAAGFVLPGEPGIWEQRFERAGFDGDVAVPVDLIVPAQLVPKAGRRGARLPRGHGKTAARKSDGVEGAVVDFDPFKITSLEESDDREIVLNVAGVAALLVAKTHKLGERLKTPGRLIAKDAGDVYRLFDATTVEEMAVALGGLLSDDRSRSTAELALGYIRRLFATPRSPGVELAAQALDGIVDRATVIAFMSDYTRDLLDTP